MRFDHSIDFNRKQTAEYHIDSIQGHIDYAFNKEITHFVMDYSAKECFKEYHGYNLEIGSFGGSYEEHFESIYCMDENLYSEFNEKFKSLVIEEEPFVNLDVDEINDKDRNSLDEIHDKMYDIISDMELMELPRIQKELEEEMLERNVEFNKVKLRGVPLVNKLKESIAEVVGRIYERGWKVIDYDIADGFDEPVHESGTRMCDYYKDPFKHSSQQEEITLEQLKIATRMSMPSIYITVENDGIDSFDVRIADHKQVKGGGWIASAYEEDGGSRAGESDFSVIVNERHGFDKAAFDEWLKLNTYDIEDVEVEQSR